MEIEYDIAKARANERKHQVSFEDAAAALLDPMAMAMEDQAAMDEARWVLIGRDSRGRPLTVVYALRGSNIRLISARRATRKEAASYAQGI